MFHRNKALTGRYPRLHSEAMNEVVNLRRARKARERAEAEAQAAANRAAFGRTKAEKQKSKKEADAMQRTLEGHKLENDG